jgi:sugar fermentation stimulation protein A
MSVAILINKRSQGVYVLVLEVERPCRIKAGRIPEKEFQQGTYLYTGRAKTHLRARLLRHLRTEKAFFWHIDYLLEKAEIRQIWVRLDFFDECQIARNIQDMLAKRGMGISGFGSSDCRCSSHLFYFNGEKRDLSALRKKIGFTKVKIDENCARTDRDCSLPL